MTTFDDRERSYEKKFAMDQELKFKAEARRNRLLGQWAAAKLGLSGVTGRRLRQSGAQGGLGGKRRWGCAAENSPGFQRKRGQHPRRGAQPHDGRIPGLGRRCHRDRRQERVVNATLPRPAPKRPCQMRLAAAGRGRLGGSTLTCPRAPHYLLADATVQPAGGEHHHGCEFARPPGGPLSPPSIPSGRRFAARPRRLPPASRRSAGSSLRRSSARRAWRRRSAIGWRSGSITPTSMPA